MRTVTTILSQIFPRLLGLLLLFTGINKIFSAAALRNVLQFDHIPQPLIKPLAWIIIIAEILLGLLLIVWPRRQILIAAMALLIFYIIQIIYLLIAHNAPNCGCLTGVIEFEDARRANALSLARNIFLFLATWLTWMQQPRESADNRTDGKNAAAVG